MADVTTIFVAAFGALGTITSGLGGYWISGRTAARNEAARDSRVAIQEQANRTAALAERLQDQRHDWQREVLLDLQDELQQLARHSGLILLQDLKTVREKGGLFLLPEGLGDVESMASTVSVRKLASRVLDDELRSQVNSFVSFCAWVNTEAVIVHKNDGPDVLTQVINTFINQLNELYSDVVAALGDHIRRELGR